MSIRKFGTPEKPQVEVDREDQQGISKSALKEQPWTERDAKELREENEQS